MPDGVIAFHGKCRVEQFIGLRNQTETGQGGEQFSNRILSRTDFNDLVRIAAF